MPDLLERSRRLELDLALGVLDDVIGFGARFRTDLFPHPLAVGSTLRDDGVGFDARTRDNLRRLRVQPLQFLLRLLRIVQRFCDRVLTRLERQQERPPGELRQQRQQHEEGDNGPDEQARIRLDQQVIHCACPFIVRSA